MGYTKNIVIWGLSTYNWLWVPLAEKLKSQLGSRIHFVSGKPQVIEYLKGQDRSGVIDTLTDLSRFYFEYDKISDSYEDITKTARAYEDKYETLVVDVLQTDRHLGRGFFSGGTNHPKSELSNKAAYLKSLNIFNKIIKFWEGYFDRYKPDLIIGVAAGIVGKSCSIVARRRGIPVRSAIQAKYQSYFCWVSGEYYLIPDLERRFKLIEDYKEYIDPQELSKMKRLPLAEQVFKKYFGYRSTLVLVRKIIGRLKSHIYYKYKRITTMGNYKLFDDIKYIYRVYRDMRRLDRLKIKEAKGLAGKSYIFYPLHTEPESALGMLSPEFNEQLALIELLAKNLPAGTFLVIKEHLSAIGRRPRDFYSTILEIPNVIMVHPYSYALDMAREAKAVVVITSSLGSEAAILGIPAISLGLHNNYNFLPHVHLVESWAEIRPLLGRLCKEDTEEEKKIRREDGMRYLAALKSSSVDMGFSNYGSKKREPATEKEVEVLYSHLQKSLGLVQRETLKIG